MEPLLLKNKSVRGKREQAGARVEEGGTRLQAELNLEIIKGGVGGMKCTNIKKQLCVAYTIYIKSGNVHFNV